MDLSQLFTAGETPFWVVLALAGLLLLLRLTRKKQGGSSSSSSRSGPKAPRSGGRAQFKEDSPGRYGDTATRELLPSSLKAVVPRYSPSRNGEPNPGEVIWTWVPYVENDGRGKDRPVLIIADLGLGEFAGCYLTSQQHRGFISVGTGEWDASRRESFLNPERLLRVHRAGMRREGGRVTELGFESAISAVRRLHKLGG